MKVQVMPVQIEKAEGPRGGIRFRYGDGRAIPIPRTEAVEAFLQDAQKAAKARAPAGTSPVPREAFMLGCAMHLGHDAEEYIRDEALRKKVAAEFEDWAGAQGLAAVKIHRQRTAKGRQWR